MAYKVIDIEGVGAAYAEKLTAAGLTTTAQLLAKCTTPSGRKALAEETGISDKLILKWANHADLFRVKGVGPQFAELLEAAGVDTVKELAHRKAENLAAKMAEVNAEKKLVRRVPVVSEVQKMVDFAKELPGVLTY
jgi:predicted flap endonuclease-1-like 5' DNA nuclease